MVVEIKIFDVDGEEFCIGGGDDAVKKDLCEEDVGD